MNIYSSLTDIIDRLEKRIDASTFSNWLLELQILSQSNSVEMLAKLQIHKEQIRRDDILQVVPPIYICP